MFVLDESELEPAGSEPSSVARAKTLGVRHFGDFLRARQRAERLTKAITPEDRDGSDLFTPRDYRQSDEHVNLTDLSRTPYLRLIHRATQQQLIVDGIRSGREAQTWSSDDSSYRAYFDLWQRNRFDMKSVAVHGDFLAHGTSYVIQGWDRDRLTGQKYLRWSPVSQVSCAAFYTRHDDEWAVFFILARKVDADWRTGRPDYWRVAIGDEVHNHLFTVEADGGDAKGWHHEQSAPHGAKVPPITRFSCDPDSNGRSNGEVAPYIPLAERADQTTYDRLIAQRYGAWKIRFVTGMARPSDDKQTKRMAEEMKQILSGQDLLVGFGDAKFGTLDGTMLDGFINSGALNDRHLAAVSQTPSYQLTGLSDNLGSEALAAAAAAQQQKIGLIKLNAGESYESNLRLSGHMLGDEKIAGDYSMQVRWRDMTVKSMTQVADALAKMRREIEVPLEMVFEQMPGWTDIDAQRALQLVDEGKVDAMIEALSASSLTAQPAAEPSAQQAAASGDEADSSAN